MSIALARFLLNGKLSCTYEPESSALAVGLKLIPGNIYIMIRPYSGIASLSHIISHNFPSISLTSSVCVMQPEQQSSLELSCIVRHLLFHFYPTLSPRSAEWCTWLFLGLAQARRSLILKLLTSPSLFPSVYAIVCISQSSPPLPLALLTGA